MPTSLGAVAAVPTGGADLSSLRFVGTGASTCPPEVLKRFLAAWGGDAVRQVYGMTEFAGAIAQVHHDVTPDGAAVGLPLAQADVAILTDDGKLHQGPSTPTGELLVRGPQVFAGYVDARQTAGAFHDGWLRTGDICRIGETGQLHIAGRIKDLIIRGGHNIDPMALEDAAMAHPGVALAAAVGLPDAYAGEVPMLFVVPAAGRRAIWPICPPSSMRGFSRRRPAPADRADRRHAADPGRQDLQAAPAGTGRRTCGTGDHRHGGARCRRDGAGGDRWHQGPASAPGSAAGHRC
ncbi:class I adenylate-forming enzyme family protein [Tistrella bauzanensis]